MQRIVIIVAVLYLLWRVVAAWGRRAAASGRSAEDFSRFSARGRDRRREAREGQVASVDLIACVHCGTFVPADRALTLDEGVVCCSRQCAAVLGTDTPAS